LFLRTRGREHRGDRRAASAVLGRATRSSSDGAGSPCSFVDDGSPTARADADRPAAGNEWRGGGFLSRAHRAENTHRLPTSPAFHALYRAPLRYEMDSDFSPTPRPRAAARRVLSATRLQSRRPGAGFALLSRGGVSDWCCCGVSSAEVGCGVSSMYSQLVAYCRAGPTGRFSAFASRCPAIHRRRAFRLCLPGRATPRRALPALQSSMPICFSATVSTGRARVPGARPEAMWLVLDCGFR